MWSQKEEKTKIKNKKIKMTEKVGTRMCCSRSMHAALTGMLLGACHCTCREAERQSIAMVN
jgi:ferredoxin-thioredoxin reductase catalytic subunit